MKKQGLGIFILSVLIIFFASCNKNDTINPDVDLKARAEFEAPGLVNVQTYCSEPVISQLIAGKDIDNPVGTVTVTAEGGYLDVVFSITSPGWFVEETHLSVTATLAEIPGWPNNPRIGNFNYNSWPTTIDGTTIVYENIPIPAPAAGESAEEAIKIHIMAHGVVNEIINEVPIEFTLPPSVKVLLGPGRNSISYFGVTISEGIPEILNGFYREGWCFDLDGGIGINVTYPAQVISSLDPNFYNLDIIEQEENLFRVNWLLNHYSVGMLASDNTPIKASEYQITLWKLIEDNLSNLSNSGYVPGDYDEAHIQEMYDAAMAVESFAPACGEFFAIVLMPYDPTTLAKKQLVIIKYPFPCMPVYSEETAWAAGFYFPGASWAMHFPFRYCN